MKSRIKQNELNKKQLRRLWINDIIIAVVVIVLSIAAYIAMPLFQKEKAVYAVVINDGVEAFSLSFDGSDDGEHRVTGDFILKLSDGEISVVKTNCSDKVCCHMRVAKSGGEIVCLPNRMIVRLAEMQDVEVDIVAG